MVNHNTTPGPGWIKTVAVFCASRPGTNGVDFPGNAFQTGYQLSKARYKIMYGGGNAGTMRELARGAVQYWLDQGLTIPEIVEARHIIGLTTPHLDAAQGTSPDGVYTEILEIPGELFQGSFADVFNGSIMVPLMLREYALIKRADASVLLPGSYGTDLETAIQSLFNDLGNIGRPQPKPLKPLVYMGLDGAWADRERHITHFHAAGLSTPERLRCSHFALEDGTRIDSPELVVAALDELNAKPPMMSSELGVKHAEAEIHGGGGGESPAPLGGFRSVRHGPSRSTSPSPSPEGPQ